MEFNNGEQRTGTCLCYSHGKISLRGFKLKCIVSEIVFSLSLENEPQDVDEMFFQNWYNGYKRVFWRRFNFCSGLGAH